MMMRRIALPATQHAGLGARFLRDNRTVGEKIGDAARSAGRRLKNAAKDVKRDAQQKPLADKVGDGLRSAKNKAKQMASEGKEKAKEQRNS
jgi:hypothetical protein